MARTMGGKRKRSHLPSWGSKKRRTIRKRRSSKKKMPRYAENSTRALKANSMLVGKHRISKRSYNHILWNLTVPKTHYRSALAIAQNLPLPVTTGVGNWNVFAAYPMTETSPFWTVAGGIQPLAFSVVPAPPVLNPQTVIIRGGMTRLAFRNTSTDSDTLRVRIQKVYYKQQKRNFSDGNDVAPASEWLNQTIINFNNGSGVSLGSSETLTLQDSADYDEYFYRPIDDKEMLLQQAEEFEVKEKLRVKKIDCDQYTRGAKYFPVYFIYVGNQVAAGAGQTFNIISSFNLSFSVVDL